MKTPNKLLLTALALGMSAWTMTAQDAGGPPPRGDGPPSGEGGPEGGPGQGRRPPPSPIITALDANGDGVIDADEIANAPAALKKLDKNGDGKLTSDEYRPQRPGGPGGPGGFGGPGGPGAPGGGQDRSQAGPGGQAGPPPAGDGPQGGPGGDGQRPPPPPIIAALDLNGDGIIDADEIAKASESLKKLDKNGDGKLTPDEFRPPRPGGPGGFDPRGEGRGLGGPPPGDGQDQPSRPARQRPSNE